MVGSCGENPVGVGGPSHTTEPPKQVPPFFCHLVWVSVFFGLKFSSPGLLSLPAKLGGGIHGTPNANGTSRSGFWIISTSFDVGQHFT